MNRNGMKVNLGLLIILSMSLVLSGCLGFGSNLADILSFDILDDEGNSVLEQEVVIDVKNGVVTGSVKAENLIDAIYGKPVITVNKGYDIYYDGEPHVNGESVYDFSESVEFTVTKDSKKSQTKTWTVILEIVSDTDPVEPGPEPLVHWTFDGKTLPSELSPSAEGKLDFVPGVSGDAMLFKDNACLVISEEFTNASLQFEEAIFTVDLWFNADSDYFYTGKWNGLFSSGSQQRKNVRLLLDGQNIGKAHIHVDGISEAAEINWETDKWHHIALLYDGNSVLMYLDGELVYENADADVQEIDFTSVVKESFIGAQYPDAGQESSKRFFGGMIDEVRIWDIALTHEQILETFNTAKQ
ncbi:MAG TPA: LamG domain-containing protein [Firmicutes bacterium]|nr:LamG domain-containing protein [Bacillota bacterium]